MPPHEIADDNGEMIPIKEYYDRRKKAADDDTWIWDRKAEAIRNHFEKIEWSDAVLVTNYDKNDISGYIGGNTLMEIGIAFFLNKPVYLFNRIPEISYKEEILGIKPIILERDLSKIA
ncbi:MAG: hypothetical protein ACOCUH_04150 [Bacteriovoracia bacterium]